MKISHTTTTDTAAQRLPRISWERVCRFRYREEKTTNPAMHKQGMRNSGLHKSTVKSIGPKIPQAWPLALIRKTLLTTVRMTTEAK